MVVKIWKEILGRRLFKANKIKIIKKDNQKDNYIKVKVIFIIYFRTLRVIKSKRDICSSDYRNNRVCFRIGIKYCLLFETLGFVSCAFTTFRGFL
jgi:hypothetical protein